MGEKDNGWAQIMYVYYRAEVKEIIILKNRNFWRMLFILKWKGRASIKQNEWIKYSCVNTYSWTFSPPNIKKKVLRDSKRKKIGYQPKNMNQTGVILLISNHDFMEKVSLGFCRRMILEPEVCIPGQTLHEMWEQIKIIQTCKNSESAPPIKSQ